MNMSLGKEMVFRLMNGDSVIGNLISETPDSYVVERPYAFQTFVIGTTPFSGKEIITLKDWLKYSIDNHIVISKNNVLAQYNPDPDMTTLYHNKKEMDDNPNISPDDVNRMMQEEMEKENTPNFNDFMNQMNNMDIDKNENSDDSFGITIPVNEDFLNDLMELLQMHAPDPAGSGTNDNIDFCDEDNDDKLNDPNEWGNHYRHWPIDPEDYT
tara:strand:+ start:259 stop:894 length:636 start_codon:yes stop_codon:yes gene_type:complete